MKKFQMMSYILCHSLRPEYIGEVKGEEFDGQGVRYELDGSVWQKGKFRDGYCVSEE